MFLLNRFNTLWYRTCQCKEVAKQIGKEVGKEIAKQIW